MITIPGFGDHVQADWPITINGMRTTARRPSPAISCCWTCYDNLVDHCCHAWNKLVAQPWTVMSIGLRDWAHGF
jgi:hypothetical protein